MDALTLNKWTRFAEKGGIGKAQGLVLKLIPLDDGLFLISRT